MQEPVSALPTDSPEKKKRPAAAFGALVGAFVMLSMVAVIAVGTWTSVISKHAAERFTRPQEAAPFVMVPVPGGGDVGFDEEGRVVQFDPATVPESWKKKIPALGGTVTVDPTAKGPVAYSRLFSVTSLATTSLVYAAGSEHAFGICVNQTAAVGVYVVDPAAANTTNGTGPYCTNCAGGAVFPIGTASARTAAGTAALSCTFYSTPLASAIGIGGVGGGGASDAGPLDYIPLDGGNVNVEATNYAGGLVLWGGDVLSTPDDFTGIAPGYLLTSSGDDTAFSSVEADSDYSTSGSYAQLNAYGNTFATTICGEDISGAAGLIFYADEVTHPHSITWDNTNTGGLILGREDRADPTVWIEPASTAKVWVQSGTLADLFRALQVTATLPGTTTSTATGVQFDVTSAGADTDAQHAMRATLGAGFTGAANTRGALLENAAEGTYALALSSGNANYGADSFAYGTTAGDVVGFQGRAGNGNRSIGTVGRAVSYDKAAAISIGATGQARNNGAGAVIVGMFAGLSAAASEIAMAYPAFTTSTVFIADNVDTSAPIFAARAAGVVRFLIDAVGGTTITGVTTDIRSADTEQLQLRGGTTGSVRVGSQSARGPADDVVIWGDNNDIETFTGSGWHRVLTGPNVTCAAGVLALDIADPITRIDANGAACVVTIDDAQAEALGPSMTAQLQVRNVGAGLVTFPNVANEHAGPTLCTTTGVGANSIYTVQFINGSTTLWAGVDCSLN